ncbi:MAG: hypothetical protein GY796_10895 [Chloroflexi bacterium]|nr:hypothetical protein [Chloroflexota bacterium]
MKLLLDQGLPRTSAARLRALGLDAVHTGEIDLATAEDVEILERAQRENRIVITLDSDFHTLLALTNATGTTTLNRGDEFGLKSEPQISFMFSVRG